ncbi:MAG: nitrogen fixation protein NifQ [Defluviicoccus sp.]|nr:MAG: nitrogen fixation protein NifQ [Defluviicoccus sp.]
MTALGDIGGARSLYVELVAYGAGDVFNRHIFACAMTIAAGEPDRALTEALGLDGRRLADLCALHFPYGRALLPAFDLEAGTGEDAIEEPDLRQLLLEHRTRGVIEEEWLAAIVARRSLRPNHLWQDLGLFNRTDLSRLLDRHFEPLARRNIQDMKWKKFFYRELCRRDGVLVCKAPVCDVCSDYHHCFSDEEGEPLARLQPVPLRA